MKEFIHRRCFIFLLLNTTVGFAKNPHCQTQLSKASTIPRNDTQLRNFIADVIRTYTQSPGTNENLKHVRRMIHRVRENQEEIRALGVDPAILEAGIYVSDMAKNPALMNKYKELYGGDFLKAMLDHSKHGIMEAALIKDKEGRTINDEQWKQIQEVIIGHDGPSLPGTWWNTNYAAKTGEEYPDITPNSKTAFIHAFLDRLDQGGIYRDSNEIYQGGLRKISYDELKFKNNDVALAIQHVFTNTHNGSKAQVDHLIKRSKEEDFFPNRSLPLFLNAAQISFNDAPNIFKRIQFSDGNISFYSRKETQILLEKNSDGSYSLTENKGSALYARRSLTPEAALTYVWNNL